MKKISFLLIPLLLAVGCAGKPAGPEKTDTAVIVPTQAPETEDKATEQPGTEAPGTDIPVTEASETELPATELPATPEDEAPWRVYLVMPSYVPYTETSDPSNLLLFPEVRFRIV